MKVYCKHFAQPERTPGCLVGRPLQHFKTPRKKERKKDSVADADKKKVCSANKIVSVSWGHTPTVAAKPRPLPRLRCPFSLASFFFHYRKGGQDISLPQGPGSELLVTGLRSVGHKEMIWSKRAT